MTTFDEDMEIIGDFHDTAYGAEWGENPDPSPEEIEIARAAFWRIMEQPEKIYVNPFNFATIAFAAKYFPVYNCAN